MPAADNPPAIRGQENRIFVRRFLRNDLKELLPPRLNEFLKNERRYKLYAALPCIDSKLPKTLLRKAAIDKYDIATYENRERHELDKFKQVCTLVEWPAKTLDNRHKRRPVIGTLSDLFQIHVPAGIE